MVWLGAPAARLVFGAAPGRTEGRADPRSIIGYPYP
jgi:hypothetical protein